MLQRNSISSFTFASALLAGILMAAPARAEAAQPARIEGVWDSVVTLRVCGGGPEIRAFRALNSFERDGSLVATSSVAPTPSLGRWERLDRDHYRATFRFLRYGADGLFEGMQQVTRTIEMDPSGDTFTSVVEIQVFDIYDVLITEGCATEVARRVF